MIDIHNLHLNYITNPQGEQTAVMLPMNEFLELMEDVEDLISIASRKNEPERDGVFTQSQRFRHSGKLEIVPKLKH